MNNDRPHMNDGRGVGALAPAREMTRGCRQREILMNRGFDELFRAGVPTERAADLVLPRFARDRRLTDAQVLGGLALRAIARERVAHDLGFKLLDELLVRLRLWG